VVIDADTLLQIDPHHVEEPENDDDPRSRIADELVEPMPEGAESRPYLAGSGRRPSRTAVTAGSSLRAPCGERTCGSRAPSATTGSS
jgi:hypothetical protein